MDFECGRLGVIEPELINKIVVGVEQIMTHLEMLEGELNNTPSQLFFPERSYVSSNFNGIFYPLKKAGDYVSKGMHVGYITDFFGKHVQEYLGQH